MTDYAPHSALIPAPRTMKAPFSFRSFAAFCCVFAVISAVVVATAAPRLPPEDPPPTPAPPPPPPPPPPPTPPGSTAPTVTLATLARAITLKHKSVSVLVAAPAGLNLGVPVRITVKFANFGVYDTVVVNNYDPAIGNHFYTNLKRGVGGKRSEGIQVLLEELVAGGKSYSYGYLPTIEPLYAVDFSELTFTLLDDGDPWGDSECAITWFFHEWSLEHRLASLQRGESFVFRSFASHRPEATVAQGLELPNFYWREEDFGYAFALPPPTVHIPVISGPDYIIPMNFTLREMTDGRNARGQFQYTVSAKLRTYLPWEL